jgi:hypothetical protein
MWLPGAGVGRRINRKGCREEGLYHEVIHDLHSRTKNENGGFPFVAQMEQGVIRVSSFTHSVASATPHATFLDSLRSIQATILKPTFTPRIFEGDHEEHEVQNKRDPNPLCPSCTRGES